MMQKSKSRNADFISIAAERQSATLGAKGPVKLKNPPAAGRSILRTFPLDLEILPNRLPVFVPAHPREDQGILPRFLKPPHIHLPWEEE